MGIIPSVNFYEVAWDHIIGDTGRIEMSPKNSNMDTIFDDFDGGCQC